MDEPLGALDKQLREQMQYEIKHLHERLGVTVVYVTHDQAEALTMSDRIAVFSDGRIQQLAAPARALRAARERLRRAVHRREQSARRGSPAHCRSRPLPRETERRRRHVTANPIASLSSGRPLSHVILSQRIALGANAGGENRWGDGRIEAAVYLGDHIRLHVAIGSLRLVANIPNTNGIVSVAVGQPIALGWRAQDCRAFPVLSLGRKESQNVRPVAAN